MSWLNLLLICGSPYLLVGVVTYIWFASKWGNSFRGLIACIVLWPLVAVSFFILWTTGDM